MSATPRQSSTSAAASAAIGGAVLMIAQQVGGKAARDALFLTHFPASDLPKFMLLVAALAIPAAFATTRALARFGPARLVPLLFVANAALFFAEWLLVEVHTDVVAAALYLHVGVVGAVAISGFWSTINERFDPHTAKRVVGRIAAGATLGGLLGGFAAERVGSTLGVPYMLVLLGLVNVAGAGLVWRVGQGRGAETAQHAEPAVSVFRSMSGSSFLRRVAALVVLTGLTSAALDYALKAEAAAALRSTESLMAFFAVFYTAMSVLTFLVQTLLTRPALERIGLGGTLAILPLAVVGVGLMGVFVTRLLTVAVLRGTEAVLGNSFFRSGYELLYTPLPPARKRATKTLIDVGGDRVGEALGSGLVLAVLALLPRVSTSATIALGVGVAAVSAWLAMRLHQSYVAELEGSLRSGAVQLEEHEVFDATTRLTLSQTATTIDRQQLLAEIDALRRRQSGESEAPRARSVEDEALLASMRELTAADPERIRAALGQKPADPRLLGQLVRLLAHDELAADAAEALRPLAKAHVGQLVDALLDHELPHEARRRLPAVIAAVDSPRAVRGLVAALADPSYGVRHVSALALRELTERTPELRPDGEVVFGAALAELGREPSWLLPREHRTLDQVFAILGLTLDREPLDLALKALRSHDKKLRGTALEYLENVLPGELRQAVWPRIEASAAPKSRSRRQLEDELKRTLGGRPSDRPAQG